MAAALAAAPPARAATPESYLAAAQNSDGGLGAARGASSSELFSGWAALAFAAQGDNPQVVRNGGQSLIAYIASQLSTRLRRRLGRAHDPGGARRGAVRHGVWRT